MADRKIQVLVADASLAKFYDADQLYVNKGLRLLKEFSHPASRKRAADLVSDSPGAAPVSTKRGSQYDPKHTPKELEMDNFARQLAEELSISCDSHSDDELIIVAPAHFHSRLMHHWPCKYTKITHIDKNYTKYPIKKLGEALYKIIYA